ncbi:hypothetical protein C8J57DRAFT_1213222 [Mycena rebaudengoi]|nr:hypothetical protein C8J57DRAFT_1213222 [Mycena rebaudengoi]
MRMGPPMQAHDEKIQHWALTNAQKLEKTGGGRENRRGIKVDPTSWPWENHSEVFPTFSVPTVPPFADFMFSVIVASGSRLVRARVLKLQGEANFFWVSEFFRVYNNSFRSSRSGKLSDEENDSQCVELDGPPEVPKRVLAEFVDILVFGSGVQGYYGYVCARTLLCNASMPQWCQFIWNEPLFWRIVLLSEGLPVEAIKATLKRAGDQCSGLFWVLRCFGVTEAINLELAYAASERAVMSSEFPGFPIFFLLLMIRCFECAAWLWYLRMFDRSRAGASVQIVLGLRLFRAFMRVAKSWMPEESIKVAWGVYSDSDECCVSYTETLAGDTELIFWTPGKQLAGKHLVAKKMIVKLNI